jgi:hypothetical protein
MWFLALLFIVLILMLFVVLSVLGFVAGIINRIVSIFGIRPSGKKVSADTAPKKDKIFTPDEGEYVEFEEVTLR